MKNFFKEFFCPLLKELLFTLNVDIVAVNREGKLVRIPKDIYEKLANKINK